MKILTYKLNGIQVQCYNDTHDQLIFFHILFFTNRYKDIYQKLFCQGEIRIQAYTIRWNKDVNSKDIGYVESYPTVKRL